MSQSYGSDCPRCRRAPKRTGPRASGFLGLREIATNGSVGSALSEQAFRFRRRTLHRELPPRWSFPPPPDRGRASALSRPRDFVSLGFPSADGVPGSRNFPALNDCPPGASVEPQQQEAACPVSYKHHLTVFKEHSRHAVFPAVLTGQSWGQSCSGLQGSVTQPVRRPATKDPLQSSSAAPALEVKTFDPNRMSACHSPNHLQAGCQGGGHTDLPDSPTLPINRLSTKLSACHSPNHLQAGCQGGGHTNLPDKQSTKSASMRCRPQRLHCPNDNATTQSEEQIMRPFVSIPCMHRRSQQKQPVGKTSRPSSRAVERSASQVSTRMGTTK